MKEIKVLFTNAGYTSYDLNSLGDKKITRLQGEYPIMLISRGKEVVDNEGSPIDCLVEDAELHIRVIHESGLEEFEKVSAAELLKVKAIIKANKTNQTWADWKMIDNFNGQLQSTNTHSDVFGGIDINATVNYREY
jgi:hypothetical protein